MITKADASESKETGMSPVVSTVLVIGITVLLSAGMGVMILNTTADGSNGTKAHTGGVTISTNGIGEVSVQLTTEPTGEFVVVDAPEQAIITGGGGLDGNQLSSAGDTVTVSGLERGDRIIITGDNGDHLVQSYKYRGKSTSSLTGTDMSSTGTITAQVN